MTQPEMYPVTENFDGYSVTACVHEWVELHIFPVKRGGDWTYVVYADIPGADGWRAMSCPHCPLRSCGDCGARPGEAHEGGCDVARCLITGSQRLSCCMVHEPGPRCDGDIWSGRWPGEDDAIRLGWYCYFAPEVTTGATGWIRCAPEHPRARPDLNRLAQDARWDRALMRWEAR
ncbi:MAG TPA: hypothetical protein VK599_07570 [Streptosporangiaceae bacterium]|nr:hypothetical protein [Streptosporangiaceae bacterium]